MDFTIINGRVLTGEGHIASVPLQLRDGVIAGSADNGPASAGQTIDAQGALILPGIIDLHGDAFERQILPRPGVHFPVDLALRETDRQLLANGITTAFHGITYSWEPGLRGRETALSLIDAIEKQRTNLGCDTRVHLRWETFNLAGERDVSDLLYDGRVDLLAFNDHAAHIGQHIAADNRRKINEYANRTGLTHDAFIGVFNDVISRAADVPPAIARLAQSARDAGIPCASHDDETIEMRSWFHELGVRLCEFPVSTEVARSAKDQGDFVILGAPNVVRDGSHCDRLCATGAVRDGVCDILTSDYYYPSLLVALFKLAERTDKTLAELWPLVSSWPAAATGMTDRGSLREGMRADMLIVDDREPGLPEVITTFVAGQPVYTSRQRVAA